MTFSTEGQVLIGLCRRFLQSDTTDHEPLDLTASQWGTLAYLAAYHRVSAVLGYYARILGAPRHVAVLYETYYLYNRERTAAFAREIRDIVHAMETNGIEVLVRKGGYLAYAIYPEAALREFNDLDLLVRKADTARAADVIRALGYAQGTLSANARTVAPIERRTEVFWRLNASSLPVFIRPAANDFVNHFRVDLRFGLLEPVMQKELPLEDWFAGAGEMHAHGVRARIASREHFLIDVAVHLYREAIALTSVEADKDLRLMRFLDLAVIFTSESARPDVPTLAALVEQYDIGREVYYALHFTDLLFPSAIPSDLLQRLRPADVEYLDQYGELDHATATWPTGFMERLFDTDRSRFVQTRSELPR